MAKKLPKKVSKVYGQVLAEHRRTVARTIERGGAQRMKKLYDAAQESLVGKLRDMAKSKAPFTAHQRALTLGQVRQGQAIIAKRLTGELGDISLTVQTESLRGLIGGIARMEEHYTGAEIALPIEEASRFRGIIDGRRESLLRSHAESMGNYGSTLVGAMEDELSQSLIEAETCGEAIDRIQEVSGMEWWQGERIARTELASAFSTTTYDGIREAAVELDDLGMRWVEYVDDDTGKPLDDRVGEDSLAMHGQIVRAGGLFHFPPTLPEGEQLPHALQKMVGKSWPCPPNRPNDRSTITPWRPHWGIPGWRLQGGRRVPM